MEQMEQRALVAKIADSWIGTPYRPNHCLKGRAGGVDCARLIAAVYKEAGVFDAGVPPVYPADAVNHPEWKDKLASELAKYALDVTGKGIYGDEHGNPPPGDIIVFLFRRGYSHCGIVTAFPKIITIGKRFVQESRIGIDPMLPWTGFKIFDPWAKEIPADAQKVTA
jgi:cell wall-associated NlpC family hydrolase